MDVNHAKYGLTNSAPHLFKHTTFFSEVVFLSSIKNNKEWISCCSAREDKLRKAFIRELIIVIHYPTPVYAWSSLSFEGTH
jgi:hypothetical protein